MFFWRKASQGEGEMDLLRDKIGRRGVAAVVLISEVSGWFMALVCEDMLVAESEFL